ncbi:MAG: hypothetical protein COW08_00640 [Ignavibacteriales bacterium CG12_big_fil_rev_8_21_14_0_65_30_8]|nr:MAG: hypothetical protein COW08_00640 [Ignavibacteriales bacterium CG12_big_fil_rev_8_21_14_0_65_30_8]
MKRKIQILPSGISLVDKKWGGLYRGGTYLLMGPRKSGRTLMALQYALECAKQKEVCLFFTSIRPKDLMIMAASIDFDLQYYMNKNLIIVIRVAPPTELYDDANKDEFLVEYLNDIITVVDQHRPNKIVFDELTQFIGFSDLERLNQVFRQTTEIIEEADITSLYILGQPAAPSSKAIVDTLSLSATGIISLDKTEEIEGEDKNKTDGGIITIIPNVGHTEGKFTSQYFIEPYRGVTIEKTGEFNAPVSKSKTQTTNETKYTSLSDIDIPDEKYVSSSFYSEEDFKLILNNQIALYKSTGQSFSVVSFKLNDAVVNRNLLTIKQLKNTIRLSTDKKDKICVVGDKVLVLLTRGEQKSTNNLISRIKSNLPVNNESEIKYILENISVFTVTPDESVENAEDVFNKISNESFETSKKIFFQ